MILRKEIRSLTPNELLKLRRAMIIFQNNNGTGSYIDLAGYHGIPKQLCGYRNEFFLAWHRIYIARFEQELRKIDNAVFLPFWNWTSTQSLEGLAPAHKDEDFINANGQQNADPLFRRTVIT